jgi:hypothetical protein
MSPLIWIVSYPRSGNTFLRALLANYVSQSDPPLPLPLSEVSKWAIGEHDERLWTRLTGQPPESRTLEAQWRARPAYFQARRAAGGGRRMVCKSHTLNGTVFDQPAFEFLPEDRVIHVVRHPCDVALSCAHYFGLGVEGAIEQLLRDGQFINGRPEHGYEVIGSWRQHTRTWLEPCPVPVRRVRYFDLVEDTHATLREIVGFLGLQPDEARLAATVEACAFGALAAQEEEAGFSEAKAARSGRFFRVGRTLQWVDKLEPSQAERLIAPSRAMLDQLGFTEFVARSRAAGR